MVEYIHYGDRKFDENKFDEIKNINFVKPFGGLWASSVNSEISWKNWCESERFHLDKYNENNYFKFKLKDNARILKITNADQLKELPKKEIPGCTSLFVTIDFEALVKQYDAIEVLISEDNRLYWDLYGWDCDSILIMNKDVIEEV